jgi:hypothetical protein
MIRTKLVLLGLLVAPFCGAAEIGPMKKATTTITGRLWSSLGNNFPITGAWGIAIDKQSEGILSHTKTNVGRAEGGHFKLFGLPKEKEIVIVAFYESRKYDMATKILETGDKSLIDLRALRTESSTYVNNEEFGILYNVKGLRENMSREEIADGLLNALAAKQLASTHGGSSDSRAKNALANPAAQQSSLEDKRLVSRNHTEIERLEEYFQYLRKEDEAGMRELSWYSVYFANRFGADHKTALSNKRNLSHNPYFKGKAEFAYSITGVSKGESANQSVVKATLRFRDVRSEERQFGFLMETHADGKWYFKHLKTD